MDKKIVLAVVFCMIIFYTSISNSNAAIVGKTTIGGSLGNDTGNRIVGSNFTMTEAGTIENVTGYFYFFYDFESPPMNLKVAVYNSTKNLIGNATQQSLVFAAYEEKWVAFDVVPDFNVSSGDVIYLVLWSSFSALYTKFDSAANAGATDAETYGVWPDPWVPVGENCNYSVYANYTPIAAGNTNPNITDIDLSPDTVYTNNTVDCSFKCIDADSGEVLKTNITWYINSGSGFAAHTSDDETQIATTNDTWTNTTATGDLESDEFNSTFQLICQANCYDDEGLYNATNSSALTVSNLNPVVSESEINPASPSTDDVLDCGMRGYDIDPQDTLKFNVTWYKDSAAHTTDDETQIAGANNTWANTSATGDIEAADTSEGESWICNATIYDDQGGSSSKNSTGKTIGNTAPTITSVADAPDPVKGGATVTITPTGQADADGENLYFYCDSSANPTSATTDCTQANTAYASPYTTMTCTFSAVADDASHTVYCRVYDGTAYSSDVTTSYTSDSTPPTILITKPVNNTAITFGDADFQDLNITFGETVDWGAYSVNGSANITTGAVAELNTTYSWGAGDWNITIYGNDSVGNMNTTFVNFTINRAASTCTNAFDKASPQVYGITVRPECTGTYADAVGANLYRDGVLKNTENNTDNTYGVATYSFICNRTVTENYTTCSDTDSYQITVATPVLVLTADNSNSGTQTRTYPNATNIQSSESNSVDGTCSYVLAENGTVISNGARTLGASVYNFTYNTTGCTNFTSAHSEIILTVSQNSSNPLSAWINSSSANILCTYGAYLNTSSKADWGALAGTLNIYRNGSLIHSGSSFIENVSLWSGGVHEFKFNTTGTVNYTSNSTGLTWRATISTAPTSCTAYLNGSTSNKIYSSAIANLTGVVNVSTLVYLDLNATGYGNNFTSGSGSVENLTNTALVADGPYNFTVHAGDENYTSCSDASVLIIDKVFPEIDFNEWETGELILLLNLNWETNDTSSVSSTALDFTKFEHNATLYNGSTNVCGGNSTYNTTCPQWISSGKYGEGIVLDGSNDYLQSTNSSAFTSYCYFEKPSTTTGWTSKCYNGTAYHENGSYVASSNVFLNFSSSHVKIGVNSSNNYFNGSIDLVQGYSRTLSPAEVLSIANHGSVYKTYNKYIGTPPNATKWRGRSVYFNISFSDTRLEGAWISVNSTNYTLTNNGVIIINFTSPGTKTFYGHANDTAGNRNTTSTRTIFITEIEPFRRS